MAQSQLFCVTSILLLCAATYIGAYQYFSCELTLDYSSIGGEKYTVLEYRLSPCSSFVELVFTPAREIHEHLLDY